MRAKFLLTFVLLTTIKGENFEESSKIKLCSVCTCSELIVDSGDFILNIICTELDKLVSMPDFDKIEWPENRNRLRVRASFEGLGFSTLGKLPPNNYIELLSFTNNMIKHYWPDPFSEVPNLRQLFLQSNELETLTADLFTKTYNLEELNLSENKLTTLARDSVENLRKLRKIYLSKNSFRAIPVEALQVLKALEELEISDNNILDVLLKNEQDVFVNLRRLNLNNNKVRTLSNEAFPERNSLENIHLSGNKIETIEDDCFMSCYTLIELDLSKNNITFNFILPNSLRVINLSQNTIHRWPAFPNSITYIDLSYNRLTEAFPNDIHYYDLELLNIAGNQIKFLTVETTFPNLYILDISYNSLEVIPESLNDQKFPNLRELHLEGNPIYIVYFKNIITLKSLVLDNMLMVTSIEDKAFSNVKGRQGEDEKECFSLSLSGCGSLSSIKDGAFEGTSLCSINLSNNNLTTISSSLLNWTGLPDDVNLQHNPWDCGCHLQWILDELLPLLYRRNSYLLNDLRCSTPRAVKDLRMVHWYNWTERAMCSDAYMRSGPNDSFLLEPKTADIFGSFTSLSLILGAAIIIVLLIAIALTVYLVKTRKRYRVRQAAMRRKRQEMRDFKRGDIIIKDQYRALNKV